MSVWTHCNCLCGNSLRRSSRYLPPRLVFSSPPTPYSLPRSWHALLICSWENIDLVWVSLAFVNGCVTSNSSSESDISVRTGPNCPCGWWNHQELTATGGHSFLRFSTRPRSRSKHCSISRSNNNLPFRFRTHNLTLLAPFDRLRPQIALPTCSYENSRPSRTWNCYFLSLRLKNRKWNHYCGHWQVPPGAGSGPQQHRRTLNRLTEQLVISVTLAVNSWSEIL